ncbi:MAG TPA: hypothetical protein PK110_10660 [Niabella sp.]|jgi:putative transposase|nr:hypothetical protein [Chitinophagaceae bacterium]HRN46479.1 hypothetical protein [Niabella sp.]HRO85274.1 hypothetical protein [Niabella sp.]HUN02851.1 hypothetical protein [Niabella sp.]
MKYNPQKHHRRSIRLKGYDYSQAGMYFITICCQNRICRFGEIINNEMVLNDFGKIAHDEWIKTTELRPNVELGKFVIMPNHIHGIIRLSRRGELHSPENEDVFDTPQPTENEDVFDTPQPPENEGVCKTPPRSPSQTVGAIVRGYKSSVTKQLHFLGFDEQLWQRNYYEHIIRNEQSYQTISNYIINNPAKWNNDKFYKD